jgi:hypothetical protein
MATETEMTAARGPGRAPVLVTRLDGQQRLFPVGAQVRVGRDPTLELVSVNPLVSRQCHGVITSDQGGATYVDQSRRGTLGEAHEALGTAVASYGQRVLSDPHALGNLVADLLPDLPRERSLLVTGAEADIAAEMREHVERHHLDPDTAVQLVASALSERRSISLAAGLWVASEYAQALGYRVRPYPSAVPARPVPQRPPGQFWPPQQPWTPNGAAPQSWPPAGPPPGWPSSAGSRCGRFPKG